jgi:catechol 2,3-dioxygenase-like lactoylglutathione lyase family enzyme
MLGKTNAAATVAVKDVGVARPFYEDTLGLKVADDGEKGVLTCKSGDTTLFVYESKFAGTNEATAVTWAVDDVDEVVRSLKGKGVRFEHYDLPGMTQRGDVHVAGSMKAAWFKDPDGNILALVSE